MLIFWSVVFFIYSMIHRAHVFAYLALFYLNSLENGMATASSNYLLLRSFHMKVFSHCTPVTTDVKGLRDFIRNRFLLSLMLKLKEIYIKRPNCCIFVKSGFLLLLDPL